jgi:aarF domain-containing kinase
MIPCDVILVIPAVQRKMLWRRTRTVSDTPQAKRPHSSAEGHHDTLHGTLTHGVAASFVMAKCLRTRAFSLRFSLPPPTHFKLPQTRHTSFWARGTTLFPRTPPRARSFLRTQAFWIVPVVGCVSLYLYPRQQPGLSDVFASPTLIPCPSCEAADPPQEPLILSPSEHDLSISDKISTFFVNHIWEPILTARRFIHLFFLFAPVILSSPMLLVGSPEARLQGDRWGAVWWYDYFVVQMDRAGPTFIKVSRITTSVVIGFTHTIC